MKKTITELAIVAVFVILSPVITMANNTPENAIETKEVDHYEVKFAEGIAIADSIGTPTMATPEETGTVQNSDETDTGIISFSTIPNPEEDREGPEELMQKTNTLSANQIIEWFKALLGIQN